MELSPQAVAAATFRTVKRGYDPDEVRAYLIEVSASLEAAHQQATAMEARARAAIAKLQDATQLAQQTPATTTGPVPVTPAPTPTVGAEEAETISRTLLLAQDIAETCPNVCKLRTQIQCLSVLANRVLKNTIVSIRMRELRVHVWSSSDGTMDVAARTSDGKYVEPLALSSFRGDLYLANDSGVYRAAGADLEKPVVRLCEMKGDGTTSPALARGSWLAFGVPPSAFAVTRLWCTASPITDGSIICSARCV